MLFAGTGVAMLAAAVAKRIHAPHAHIFFETGGIGPPLDELPMAVADPRVMAFSNLNAGLVEAFSYVANRRLHTIAFLGAAQVDKYGNMNSTVIGDYRCAHRALQRQRRRLRRRVAGQRLHRLHAARREEVRREARLPDHPGWLSGGDSRRRAGYRRGGPIAVVTNLGVLQLPRGDARDVPRRALRGRHRRAHPGEHRLRAWTSSRATVTVPPTAEELRILRDDVDPQRLILG